MKKLLEPHPLHRKIYHIDFRLRLQKCNLYNKILNIVDNQKAVLIWDVNNFKFDWLCWCYFSLLTRTRYYKWWKFYQEWNDDGQCKISFEEGSPLAIARITWFRCARTLLCGIVSFCLNNDKRWKKYFGKHVLATTNFYQIHWLLKIHFEPHCNFLWFWSFLKMMFLVSCLLAILPGQEYWDLLRVRFQVVSRWCWTVSRLDWVSGFTKRYIVLKKRGVSSH